MCTWFVRPFVVALVALVSVLAPGSTMALAQDAPLPPSNLHVDPFYQETVARLLQRSGTFAGQCRRIAAAPHVRVTIVAAAAPKTLTEARARSHITRHVYGAIRAVVEIPVNGEHAELIGHELEHVIEQIEGLDLPLLARAGAADVAEIEAGVYETARAKRAGLVVADEWRGGESSGAARSVASVVRVLRARASRTGPTRLSRR